MIKITCTNCQKPLSLDETKLPMNKEVAFPCPVCKTRLTVDRRDHEAGAAAAPAQPPAQAAAPAATSAPAASSAPAAAGADDDNHENDFGAKALIAGSDSPAIRQAAKLIGFLPVFQGDLARARDYVIQEAPQVVFINPPQLTPPPLESMHPVISITGADRRKTFIILVADNLRTLDGNAAFLYGVNLVVATKDLPQLPQIYRDASAFHERFYSSMNGVLRSMNA